MEIRNELDELSKDIKTNLCKKGKCVNCPFSVDCKPSRCLPTVIERINDELWSVQYRFNELMGEIKDD